jgi:polar amino acid transport system substrate-binding protein
MHLKSIRPGAMLGVFLAALIGGLSCQAVQAITLKQVKQRGFVRIAVANEIPYGYMNIEGKAVGAGPEVARAVLKRMGINDTQWVVTQFGSLIPGLKAGRFDMVAAEMAVLPARCKQVMYSEPNTSYGEGLLVAKGNPKGVHAYSDFASHDWKVAIMAGADQLGMLQKLKVPEDRITIINSNADAISTVSTGRAVAYAATGLTAAELAQKSPRVELASPFTDPVIDGKEVRSWGAFTFSRNSRSFRDAFNKQLVAFKKTPAWKKILSHYGFTDKDIDMSFKRTTAELCK